MVVCFIMYVALAVSRLWHKKRKIFWTLFLCNSIALAMFAMEFFQGEGGQTLERNSYGEGDYTASYKVSVEGELAEEPIAIEVGEQEYSEEQTETVFKEVIEELDTIILGENKSLDYVEKDLSLPKKVDGYPVNIRWELDSYQVMDTEGKIKEDKVVEEGTPVELRGILSYKSMETTYIRQVMVYPRTKTGKDKWLDAVANAIVEAETTTKKQKSFELPSEIQGKKITWERETDNKGYFLLVIGIILSGAFLWKEVEDKKEQNQKRKKEMLRDYPNIVNKYALLFGTGMTTKNVWMKIVQEYENQKERTGMKQAYEEMCVTLREMQSGVPEKEAYERFGKRCGMAQYMKLGAMLSQNVKKGSRGFCDTLKLEALQSFENRKREAKQLGEEASTKLLLPMFGMLAVVMIMVIVPAFLSIQL